MYGTADFDQCMISAAAMSAQVAGCTDSRKRIIHTMTSIGCNECAGRTVTARWAYVMSRLHVGTS